MSTSVPVLPRPRAPLHSPPSSALSPAALSRLSRPDAFLAYDLRVVGERVRDFRSAFRGRVGVHYAIKCNPDPRVLTTVARAGGGFEIASLDRGFQASTVLTITAAPYVLGVARSPQRARAPLRADAAGGATRAGRA